MADGPRISVRALLRWIFVALLILYSLVDLDPASEDLEEVEPDRAADTTPDANEIGVLDVRPKKVGPGGAVIVTVAKDRKDLTITAEVDGEPAALLHSEEDQRVFELPADARTGYASLVLHSDGLKSKPQELEVRSIKRRKVLRNVIGGLALVVFGLRILSRGLRRRAGEGLRAALGRMTSGSWRSFAVGLLTGGLTGTGATVAGLAVGSLQTRLLTFVSALGVIAGAQLGAALVGAGVQLGASREALMLVGLGVAWLLLSNDQRRRSLAEIVLGLGLLFHGIQVLRVGFSPLVEDPEVLPYLRYLNAETVAGIVACGLFGMLLCTLLQGPGPVFALVLGLVQSTGIIGVDEGLAIMAGTALGTAMSTVIVAWPSGLSARRLASAHLVFAALTVVVILVTLPLWISIAASIAGSDANAVEYGKKILHPNASLHLALSFIASQLIVTTALAPLVGPLARKLGPSERGERGEANGESGIRGGASDDPRHRRRVLEAMLTQRSALEHIALLCRSGVRVHASDAGDQLAASRRDLDALVDDFDVGKRERKHKRSALAMVHLQGALESLLRVADRGVERGLKLEEADREVLDVLNRHLEEAIGELSEALGHDDLAVLDMDSARAREIEVNAVEARHRKRLLEAEEVQDVAKRVLVSELFGAYEGVANHFYRLYESYAGQSS
jgi:phosphate:Na+ symporter